ncbi:calcium-binding and coiled-coil domain-containing protein 2 [Elgaria multicarinata webbii]|uniref:calcium-binding and coiled-coil domain-containing protein 2 n=1 Tax=Elgaria multicarinata webbii TaxID=159646 RepID=UPI002FCCCDF1
MEAALCNSSDEPPTSAILMDSSHFSQVVFTNVEKFYVPGADITCRYSLSQHITPRRKDWVGIFRVGWKTTCEYYTFMWATLPSRPKGSDAEFLEVLFKAYYLPKDDEYYQFCYVDQDGQVRGASIPFQLRVEVEDDMLVVTTQGEVEEIEQQNTTLLQENHKLKENLTSLQKQHEDLQEKFRTTEEKAKELEDKVRLLQTGTMELQRAQDLQALEKSSVQTELATVREKNTKLQEKNEDLQRSLDTMRSSNEKLDSEVCLLKKKIRYLETQSSSTEAELCQVKEEKKNMSSEKEQLDNKLKNTLVCLDKFQSQVQCQEKELENLQAAYQDTTRCLEQLKKDNHQLNGTLLKQKDLEVKLEEKTLLLQTLQKEKDEMEKENQTLRQENQDLMAHFPEMRGDAPSGFLTQSQENSVLLFGNPYVAPPESPETDFVSVKTCPLCNEVFPNDIGEEQYSVHVRSHLLECPYCSETFDNSSKQVFNDHIFCHNLD